MALIKKENAVSPATDERHVRRDPAGLIEGLTDPDPMVRRWSARDLAEYPNASLSLVSALRAEAENSVREVIITSLTRIGDETAVEGLVACLHSDDALLRNEAIEAMKALPEKVAPLMGRLLHDPDSDVRIFAVNVLESLRHPDVEAWLLDVIEHDPHINVCATALDLLGEVGSEKAKAPLERLKARFSEDPYIQFVCDLALKRIVGE
jgi:HEAT repeat protein